MRIDGIDTFVALGKDNADAMVQSGTAAMRGFEAMAKAGQALAARQTETMEAAVKALFACRSVADFADLQGRLARESMETAIAEGRKFADLATAAATATLQPLTQRATAFQASATSAA